MKNLSLFKGMAALGIAHFVVDLMLGVWPVYKTLARLDLTKAGLMVGLGMFFGEGAQLLFGYLGDRGGQKGLLLLGLVLAGSVAGFAYTQSYLILFTLVFFCFLGSSAFHPSAVGVIRRLDSENAGFFMTLFFLAGTLGAAASQLVFTKTYESFGGHTWGLLLPIAAVFLFLSFQRFPKQQSASGKRERNIKSLWNSLGENRLKLMLLFLTQTLMQTVLLSFKFLLSDVLELGGAPAWFSLGGAYAFFITGVSLMVFLSGWLIDRIPSRSLLRSAVSGALIFYFLFIALLFYGKGASLIFLGPVIFFLGGFMGISYPLVVSAGCKLVPEEAGSFTGAFLMGAAACLASLGVIGTSFLTSLFQGFAPLKSLALLGCLFIVMMGIMEMFPKDGKGRVCSIRAQ